MLERIIVAAVLFALFAFGFVNALMTHRKGLEVLARIRKLDPEKAEELTRFGNRLVGHFLAYNPAKFNEFIRSGQDMGDPQLTEQLRKLRAIPWLAIVSWVTLVVAMLALALLAAIL